MDQCLVERDGDFLVISATNGNVRSVLRFDLGAAEKLIMEIEAVCSEIERDKLGPLPSLKDVRGILKPKT